MQWTLHLIANVNFKTGIVNRFIIFKSINNIKFSVFLFFEQIKTQILNKSQINHSVVLLFQKFPSLLFQSQICTYNPNILYFLKNVHFAKFLTNIHQTRYSNISVSLSNQLGIFRLLKTSTTSNIWNKFPKSKSSLSSSSLIVSH